MLEGKKVAVAVPAHNEETQIGKVLTTLPDIVDHVVVVDDASTDRTAEIAESHGDKVPGTLEVRRRERTGGVGAAIIDGYRAALAAGADVVAVMAGDAQMDPDELEVIVGPVVRGDCDYAKGNRLLSGRAWRTIPRYRYLGNAMLTLLTKIASGYWHVTDSQSGYTAISRKALEAIELDRLYPRYGFPNDLLVHLNVYHFGVKDVPIEPLYGVGEKSGIRLWRVVPTLSFLLFRRFFWRMVQKYVIRDFHPLVFFYGGGSVLLLAGLALGLVETYQKLVHGKIAIATVVLVALLLTSGLQLVLFAMWFDMEYNKELK